MIEFVVITLLVAAIILTAGQYCYDNGIKVPLFGRLIESDGDIVVGLALSPVVNVVFLALMVFLFLVKFIRGKTI